MNQQEPSSKDNSSPNKKTSSRTIDTAVVIAIITTVGGIVTALITSVIAPLFTKPPSSPSVNSSPSIVPTNPLPTIIPTPPGYAARKINQTGLKLIMAFEPLVLETTTDPIDPSGVPMIGYGTTKGVRRGMKITQAEAEVLLKIDLESVEKSVINLVKVPLDDNQFSALVSFAHNLGSTTLADSTLLKVLNSGDYKKASDEFLIWDNGGREVNPDPSKVIPDLSLRRQAERALFLGYGVQPFIDSKNAQK